MIVWMLLLGLLCLACGGMINPFSSTSGALSGDYCSGSTRQKLPYAGGSGSFADPYTFCNAAQIVNFASQTGDFNKYFKVMADIDFGNLSFAGIGSIANPFTGNFDGNGKTISSFTIIGTTNKGFFNLVSGGTIQDLHLAQATITGTSAVGGLVGYFLALARF